MHKQPKLTRFQENVLSKYQIYNSIFMTLPFDTITKTGVLLPLFHEICKNGFSSKQDPTEIVENFFKTYQQNPSEEERINLLFRFIQYIERQVVLFDAIEDAAFPIVNNMDGVGTMRNTKETAAQENKKEDLQKYLEDFKVRIVLTAHPTQFYPGPVLGIITDLAEAIEKDDLLLINKLLAQLGKTPFFKHEKPTPYDEAVSLIWYLENVFYHSISDTYNYIQNNIFDGKKIPNQIIDLGFWPGGDRDGNPFVTTEITLNVAKRLKQTILKNYYRDIRILKKRLTFNGVEDYITELEVLLFDNSVNPDLNTMLSLTDFIARLEEIRSIIIEKHQSLYEDEINDFINKVHLFGYHFATLDIRQDSRVHHNVFSEIVTTLQEHGNTEFPENYLELSEAKQIEILSKVKGSIDIDIFDNEMVTKTLSSIVAVKSIQESNGERGSNRYIISNNQKALNVMETFAMFNLCGFNHNITVDIIPLFETITDLENAEGVMSKLYENKAYMTHLAQRGHKQTIMLGFSDGTKDGGYLMANWAIFKAKENLTKISRAYGIKVIFFDGRGGPPARGGGKTHQFYASLGPSIENKEIQLTIQGQTISSNFGTQDAAQYNIEQLLSAGISNELFSNVNNVMTKKDVEIMDSLATVSYQAYSDFKNHPKFLPYLERMSTLKYYAKTNIGSRPSKRSSGNEFNFSDLRAIPFVGSWSQLKQNVPGFYGVGTALKKYEDAGEFDKLINLYNTSDFFKALIGNSMMSLSKSFFGLTQYMEKDEEFGDFWKIIFKEYETTHRLILKLTGYTKLMQSNKVGKASIDIREDIVLPLITIQQFALINIQKLQKDENADPELIKTFEKMVTRSLFGNINASRNSA
ncbi:MULTISPECIES: phosphoenolpyruvate carboxylase [Flavobacteriaceae]|uniref:Phosphoenolpyruvate carboxylase n=2 Tax=Flavobacteriaceae TaxID=49546 RepID=A0A4Y8ARK6_9FLAO|nr:MULTISPECIES: phosphoenolpyruvate carboxylase [Flavobacteriaceae]TEW72854.1 phosphoenolpyruvate carboxylase [Gramella jeungdoensis]GGK49119.1 phosphoenolpyruvate carboxylase [Lutibacter litoralis]